MYLYPSAVVRTAEPESLTTSRLGGVGKTLLDFLAQRPEAVVIATNRRNQLSWAGFRRVWAS